MSVYTVVTVIVKTVLSFLLSGFQRIAAVDLAAGLQYFGRSIHGTMDMNDDGLVDLAVGSLGAAILLWFVHHLKTTVTFKQQSNCLNIKLTFI